MSNAQFTVHVPSAQEYQRFHERQCQNAQSWFTHHLHKNISDFTRRQCPNAQSRFTYSLHKNISDFMNDNVQNAQSRFTHYLHKNISDFTRRQCPNAQSRFTYHLHKNISDFMNDNVKMPSRGSRTTCTRVSAIHSITMSECLVMGHIPAAPEYQWFNLLNSQNCTQSCLHTHYKNISDSTL
jgi:hypothetical protein